MAKIDFEAEGLLDGVDGEAREARRELLEQLAADGVPLEELRRAVEEDRLVLVPVERRIGGEARFTAEEVAERAGLEVEALLKQRRALGVPAPGEGERSFTEADVEAAKQIKAFADAGLPEEQMLEISRVLGVAMAQVAAANRAMIGELLFRPGDTERDLGIKFARAAEQLIPLLGPTLTYTHNLHLRSQISSDVIGRAELQSGSLTGSIDVTICFADLVGFTKLGERVEVEQLGAVAGRLGEIATATVEPPVRVVKLIGDAVMLAAPEPEPVVAAALDLVDAAEKDTIPSLRAGVARGEAMARGGDWFGRPVNLAARITGIARPASVVASSEVREAIGNRYRWSRIGRRRLKGIHGMVELWRVRRTEGLRGRFARGR
jgi:adenylate cyclase